MHYDRAWPWYQEPALQSCPAPGAAAAQRAAAQVVYQELLQLPPPSVRHTHHVYCSPLNPGAFEVMRELADAQELELTTPVEADPTAGEPSCGESPNLNMVEGPSATRVERSASGTSAFSSASTRSTAYARRRPLYVTTVFDQLTQCDHMLLHLHARTWTSGQTSE